MSETVTLHELTAERNWRGSRMPEWAERDSRVYAGVPVSAAGVTWPEIVTHFDGRRTTAYLTRCGFDLRRRGPALHVVSGETACHRKVLREWFRATWGQVVRFE